MFPARLGRGTEAETMYRKAVGLRPDLWQNHRALGNFLLGQGRFEEAKNHIVTSSGYGRKATSATTIWLLLISASGSWTNLKCICWQL